MRELRRSKLMGPVANVFSATKTGTWRLERPEINQAACVRCGNCAKYCPCDAITVDREKGLSILWEYCKGCGICANECPKQCINMISEEGAGT